MGQTQLGRMQFRIMQVLWDLGRASAREITDALCSAEPVAHSTVQTLLASARGQGGGGARGHGAHLFVLCEAQGRPGQAHGGTRPSRSGFRRQRGEPGRSLAQERAAFSKGARRAQAADRQRARGLIKRHRRERGAPMGNGLTAIMRDVSGFGLTWLVQSSVLLALGLLAGRLLRRSGPAVQSGVYRTTLAAVLICPVASVALSARRASTGCRCDCPRRRRVGRPSSFRGRPRTRWTLPGNRSCRAGARVRAREQG